MKDVGPSKDAVDKFATGILEMKDKFSQESDLMKKLSSNVNGKWDLFNQWLEEVKEARRLELEGS